MDFEKADSNNLPRVDIFMVMEFLKNNDCYNISEVRGTKALRSSRECYGDSAIGYVQIKRESSRCIVQGRICPEYRVRAKAYTVEVVLDEKDEKVEEASCNDCVASQGGCKHALAFLMWLHRRSEDPATTEVKCYWKKARLSTVGSNLKFVKASNFPRAVSSKTLTKPGTANFLSDIRRIAKQQNIDCQLFRYHHFEEYRPLSLHDLMVEFVKNGSTSVDEFLLFASEKHTDELCDGMSLATKGQSSNPLWHELRYGRITASKVYDVLHCNSVSNAFVQNIIGSNKICDTVAMARGRNLESSVFDVLSENIGLKIEKCGLIVSPSSPLLGASADGITKDFVVEIKCPFSEKAHSKYILGNGKIASKYFAQIQMQMHVTKREKALFCVADPKFEENKNIRIAWLDYDKDYCKVAIDNVMTFWKTYIFPLLLDAAK